MNGLGRSWGVFCSVKKKMLGFLLFSRRKRKRKKKKTRKNRWKKEDRMDRKRRS